MALEVGNCKGQMSICCRALWGGNVVTDQQYHPWALLGMCLGVRELNAKTWGKDKQVSEEQDGDSDQIEQGTETSREGVSLCK